LGLSTPSYAHLPVATNSHGEKLSKQTEAEPVSVTQPLPLLHRALRFLGQPTPDERGARDLEGFWRWAVDHWRLECVPREPRLTLKL
jgi:glutamyl-Q tRNA(Asp) synthetase